MDGRFASPGAVNIADGIWRWGVKSPATGSAHQAIIERRCLKVVKVKAGQVAVGRTATEVIVVPEDNFFDRLGFGTGHTGGRQERKTDSDLDGLSKERKSFGIF